ncbi:MAG: hypothetical protein NWQ45_01240, partial [Congregibacter sp.]|nr:hypothetical protein [Congregibacter sp.]
MILLKQRFPRRSVRLMLCLLLCVGLAACGFQLRGTGGGSALPAEWRSMDLDSNEPNGELTRIV